MCTYKGNAISPANLAQKRKSAPSTRLLLKTHSLKSFGSDEVDSENDDGNFDSESPIRKNSSISHEKVCLVVFFKTKSIVRTDLHCCVALYRLFFYFILGIRKQPQTIQKKNKKKYLCFILG